MKICHKYFTMRFEKSFKARIKLNHIRYNIAVVDRASQYYCALLVQEHHIEVVEFTLG